MFVIPKAFFKTVQKKSIALMSVATNLEKLTILRNEMKSRGLGAYIVPSEDQHISEYVPECYARRKWISEFTGSAGTAVITEKEALLWTDSRYFVQAEEELPSGWQLMKMGLLSTPKIDMWIREKLPKSTKVGVDGGLISADCGSRWKKSLHTSNQGLVCISDNLIDLIWKDRPEEPQTRIICLSKEDAGLTTMEKMKSVQQTMKEKKCNVALFPDLSDICWFLNIRGEDIAFNPFVYSWLLIESEKIHFFVEKNRLTSSVRTHLGEASVIIHDYREFYSFVETLANDEMNRFLYDNTQANYRLFSIIEHCACQCCISPITILKSRKNDTEIAHIKKAFLMDSIALCTFMQWLEANIDHHLTEYEIAAKTTELRHSIANSCGDSFAPIVGYSRNAAIVHYEPENGKAAVVGRDACILIDTGGQYHWGTTDITRTVVFPTSKDLSGVSHDFRVAYTAVLKGHIALATARFPERTPGYRLDILARQYLYQLGLDYGHGTGHGVGCYLGVHEGPEHVSTRGDKSSPGFMEGMLITDEPGYYNEKKGFGARIETTLYILLLVEIKNPLMLSLTEKISLSETYNDLTFLQFYPLSYVPIQADLCIKEMMSVKEKQWLCDYNHACVDKLKEWIQDEKVLSWMRIQAEKAELL